LEKQFGEASEREKAIEKTLAKYGVRRTGSDGSGGAWEGYL